MVVIDWGCGSSLVYGRAIGVEVIELFGGNVRALREAHALPNGHGGSGKVVGSALHLSMVTGAFCSMFLFVSSSIVGILMSCVTYLIELIYE